MSEYRSTPVKVEDLSSILNELSTKSGQDFLNQVCRSLHKTIDADFTFIATVDPDLTVSTTRALIVADGRVADNFSYNLEGTPCHDVSNGSVCCYEKRVTQYFPDDTLLIDMGVEGYLGTPLHSSKGQVIGLIVALYQKPVHNRAYTTALFHLFSSRISAELEKMDKQQELQQANKRFEDIVASSSEWIWELNAQGHYTYSSGNTIHIMGYSTDEILGKTPFDFMPPEEAKRISRKFTASVQRREKFTDLYNQVLHKDGRLLHVYSTGIPIFDDSGEFIGYRGTDRDATKQQQALERLRFISRAFEYSQEGIMLTDKDATIIEVNRRFSEVTGYSPADVHNKKPSVLSSGRHSLSFYQSMWKSIIDHHYWQGEIWNRRKTGEEYVISLTISAITDKKGNVSHYIGQFTDITLLKQQQRHIEHITNYDPLTGTLNRNLLEDRLYQAIISCKRNKKSLAVCYLDIDNFRKNLEHYGKEWADTLLIKVASRIQSTLGVNDSLARIGADEFVFVLADLSSRDGAEQIFDRIADQLSQPFTIDGQAVNLSATIGAAMYPEDHSETESLIRHAAQALYSAKLKNKGRFHFFDSQHDQQTRALESKVTMIETALNNQEFELFYQPKVNMLTGQALGAEALIRWQHPKRGTLSPIEFLPYIENNPLMLELDRWVLEEAIKQAAQWHQTNQPLRVSINLSAMLLQQPDLPELLQHLLHTYRVPADMIELEILETALLDDLEGITETIVSCSNMGIVFALDDFGTGYSSLLYLKKLPVQIIKIDQSFIRDLTNNNDDTAIVDGIIGLADAFNKEVIAEGVETPLHAKLLLKMGCELGQGYGIGKPMPANALNDWLKQWQHKPWL